jgi:predicted DNA binding CopG/RHH family protein
MTDTPTTEAPIMLRADITRDELAALKVRAIRAGMTTQQLLAKIIREHLDGKIPA